jgi:hypothetical protein
MEMNLDKSRLTEKLESLESKLRELAQLTPQTEKGRKKIESESESIKERIKNLKAFLIFSEGQRVSDGKQIGTISQLSLSKEGLPEAWVKWDDGRVPIPETPSRLSPVAIMPEVVEESQLEELSADEERDRLFLERKVERAFYEAGKALQKLRDRRLYRSTHKTFEDYCRARFGHSRQKANYLIAGAEVYENLTTICCQESLTTNGLPKNLGLKPRRSTTALYYNVIGLNSLSGW